MASKTVPSKYAKMAPAPAPAPKATTMLTAVTAREDSHSKSQSMDSKRVAMTANTPTIASPAPTTKKLPVNRNFYEAVDGGLTGTTTAKSTTSSGKPVNRNVYEAVGEDLGADSKKPGGGDYVVVADLGGGGGGSAKTEIAADDDTMSDDSKREKRRLLRRMKRIREEEKLMGQTRMLVIGCSCLITIVLIVAAVGGCVFLFYLSQMIGNKGKGDDNRVKPTGISAKGNVTNATSGFQECMNHISGTDDVIIGKKKAANPRCVTVWSTDQPCEVGCAKWEITISTGTTATKFEHFAMNVSTQLMVPKLNSRVYPLKMDQNVFCQGQTSNKKLPLVCVPGRNKCDYQYTGPKIERGNKAQWFDNCDKKPQCLEVTNTIFVDAMLETDLFKREQCNENATCWPGANAAIYLQIMQCIFDDNVQNGFCSPDDGMIRLFKCRECGGLNRTKLMNMTCEMKGYESYASDEDNSCIVWCSRPGVNGSIDALGVMLPNGANCTPPERRESHIKDDGFHDDEIEHERGFCVFGTCLPWDKKNLAGSIFSMTDCENNKKMLEMWG